MSLKGIGVIASNSNNNIYELKLKIENSVSEIITYGEKNNDSLKKSFIQFKNILGDKDLSNSILNLITTKNGVKNRFSSLYVNNNGINVQDFSPPDLTSTTFIPSGFKVTNKDLAQEYDKVQLSNIEEKALKAFQIIDNTIEKIKTISIGEPTIFIKQNGKDYLPISLFGDAINKIGNLILQVLNNPNGTILIDEIENGIHYSNQEQLWKYIFELAETFNVQIFATTHSLEMIQSFIKVTEQKDNLSIGGYFDLYRHANTGEIAMNEHQPSVLKYEVKQNMSIRG